MTLPSSSLFLSTPSARRATFALDTKVAGHARFLSTPSARRATQAGAEHGGYRQISIHALREEGDMVRRTSYKSGKIFLSTPSARRATVETYEAAETTVDISIHALREEGDPGAAYGAALGSIFLSTPSARRATA